VGLAGEAVVVVKVCIKIGFRICSEDCFASGFFVKDCVWGCFEVSFWVIGEVKIGFEVFVKVCQC
jgi:hypothetical protein